MVEKAPTMNTVVEIRCWPPDFAELLIFNPSSELKILQIYLNEYLSFMTAIHLLELMPLED